MGMLKAIPAHLYSEPVWPGSLPSFFIATCHELQSQTSSQSMV